MAKKGGTRHENRLMGAKTRSFARKGHKWGVRPNPGPHARETSVPLADMIRTIGLAQTRAEVKRVLNTRAIKINGRVRTSEKFPVGLFDWVQVETGNAKTAYRVLIEKHGRLVPEERSVPKEPFKLSKITKKTAQAKKTVTLTGNDAETWNMAKTDIRVNDSVRWTFHNRKIADTFKLEKGNTVLIVGGERRGGLASIVDIVPGSVTRPALVKLKPQTGDEFQTTVNNVFVIGNANAKTDW